MTDVLSAKRQEVIGTLIGRLSGQNNAVEDALNAQMIMLEMVDNEHAYGRLLDNEDHVKELIVSACDIKNPS